jgi:two-component system, LytTR family, response regulator
MLSTCVIVEDEPLSAERLKLMLTKYHLHEVKVLEILLDFKHIEHTLKTLNPDLVFFDVQINDHNTIELLKEFPHPNFEIIFTTGHSKYAPMAFRLDAVDFLLKPIDRNELADALEKFKKRKVNQREKKFESAILNQINFMTGDKKISINTLNGMELISVREIIRCHADINYTHLFLKNRNKLTVAKTLKEFEHLLCKLGFMRVHNSSLVNLREIKSYQKGKGGTLRMSDEAEVEVSTRKKEALLQALREGP